MTRCEHCGAQADLAREICPACGAYATLIPFVEPPTQAATPNALAVDCSELGQPVTLRVSTNFEPWNDALCGGVVMGSTLVLYGREGTRKTTWAGAIADAVACNRQGRALYLSAEMPSVQVRDAVMRRRLPQALSIVGSERDAYLLDRCLIEVQRMRPRVVVYDSIQAFDVAGAIGTDAAVATLVQMARRYASIYGHLAILICQVNKAGEPAGPHRTLHDCDVIVHLELDKVTVKKNRFGAAPRESALTSDGSRFSGAG